MNGLLSQLTRETPVIRQTLALDAEWLNTGLAIEDEVKGFAAHGSGKLAPLDKNVQVSRMVEETGRLARSFMAQGRQRILSSDSLKHLQQFGRAFVCVPHYQVAFDATLYRLFRGRAGATPPVPEKRSTSQTRLDS